MSSQKDAHLENIRSIQAQVLQLLDGMDYCLDWKPDPDEWSAKEVLYHLLDTPPGGVPAVLKGMLFGEQTEFDVWGDLSNMTTERQTYDMEQVLEDIGGFFRDLEEATVAAAEEDFEGKVVMAHMRTRGGDRERSAKMLLEGLFARHWRDHLEQIRELRESLGV